MPSNIGGNIYDFITPDGVTCIYFLLIDMKPKQLPNADPAAVISFEFDFVTQHIKRQVFRDRYLP